MTTDWVQRLNLARHPEGGWFRRIHSAPAPEDSRPSASAIHYLLNRASPIGHLHRNGSTILHFVQSGGPAEFWLLSGAGALRRVVLGFEPGQALFLEVPDGMWKASRLIGGADHALVSEVVIPAWREEDHEFMTRETLETQFPQHVSALGGLIR